MKAITLWQPWASLVAIGAKRFETRSWRTNYRGPIAIHAGTRPPREAMSGLSCDVQKAILDSLYKAYGVQSGVLEMLPTGAVIATAELIGCWSIWEGWRVGLRGIPCIDQPNQWRAIIEPEYTFGDFTPGRFAWELADIKMLDIPIPAKGRQGLWSWEVSDG